MEMTEKRKKQLWIAGGIIAALYFGPSIFRPIQYAIARQRYEAMQQQKPSPIHPMLPQQAIQSAMPDASLAQFSGKYMGDALLKTRQCRAGLELKANPLTPGQFDGYITMECFPSTMATKGAGPFIASDPIKAAALMSSPASAVLTGTVVNGSLKMKATKTVESLADGCPIAGISLVPFGTNQLAMDFSETGCEGGQLIVARQ
jgi:hypothetical protein